jgi:hypothetical protein
MDDAFAFQFMWDIEGMRPSTPELHSDFTLIHF